MARPGCAECGVIPLSRPHICEHGVTPATLDFELQTSKMYVSPVAYERLKELFPTVADAQDEA